MLSVLAVLLTGITLAIATGIRVFSPLKFQSGMSILLAFMLLWSLLGAQVLLSALTVFLLQNEGARRETFQVPGIPVRTEK